MNENVEFIIRYIITVALGILFLFIGINLWNVNMNEVGIFKFMIGYLSIVFAVKVRI